MLDRGVGLPWSPELCKGKPLAIFHRQVATPNYETLRFLSIASGFGLEPLILEYHDDLHSMANVFKKSLVRLPVIRKISLRGCLNYKNEWVIPHTLINKRLRLNDITTCTGQSLPELHKDLFRAVNFSSLANSLDLSSWYRSAGGKAEIYYSPFLSLFVAHAILFESFSYSREEIEFTEKIVQPAIDESVRSFGVAPLIVPLNPTGIEDAQFWTCYPPEVGQALETKCSLEKRREAVAHPRVTQKSQIQ